MSEKLLQALGEGKVYFPVGKILRESTNRIDAFVLFEATEKSWVTLPPKILKLAVANGYDIRGFLTNSTQPNSYFRQVRVYSDDDSKSQWLLYKKEIIGRKTVYHMISEDAEERAMSREEIVDFISKGNVVLGTKILGEKVLITAALIVQINNGYVCKNSLSVKRIPRAKELYEMMKKEKASQNQHEA